MPISFSIPSSLSVSGTTTTAALTVGSLTGVLKASSGVVSVATPGTDFASVGAVTTSGLTMSTAKMLGRATASTGAIEEISVTGSGSAVLATSPTLVTPILGVATGTSIVLSGTITDQGGTLASQRNALAPAQGLVASGAAVGANATLANVLGTGDFSIAFDIDVPASAPATAAALFHLATLRAASTASDLTIIQSSADQFRLVFRSNPAGSERIVYFPAFSATYGGTRVHGVFTRTGATIALKLNDVAVTITADTAGGSPPAWSDSMPGTLLTLGQFGDSFPWTGFFSAKLYNYVLSSAQQTRLFRTGAVDAADINTVYNDANAVSLGNPIGAGQSMINGDNSTAASNTGFWTLGGGTPATISGGVFNFPTGASTVSRANFLKVGSVYTLLVGSKTGNLVFDGGVTSTAITAGTPITFTATQATLQFYTTAGGTMDDVTLVPLGATFAPEAAAPGAGLEWLDTSGNRSHTVLPTSGISWALPSSQQIVIEATTNTATNQQLAGASIIDTNKQWRIQSWTVNCSTGTPTISLGNVSAGAQYVSGAVLAAGNNDITLLTRFPTTANLWCNSSTTATLIHRIVLVPAN